MNVGDHLTARKAASDSTATPHGHHACLCDGLLFQFLLAAAAAAYLCGYAAAPSWPVCLPKQQSYLGTAADGDLGKHHPQRFP
jgi:hypothetical protein